MGPLHASYEILKEPIYRRLLFDEKPGPALLVSNFYTVGLNTRHVFEGDEHVFVGCIIADSDDDIGPCLLALDPLLDKEAFVGMERADFDDFFTPDYLDGFVRKNLFEFEEEFVR